MEIKKNSKCIFQYTIYFYNFYFRKRQDFKSVKCLKSIILFP
jgi:hypothetical protein